MLSFCSFNKLFNVIKLGCCLSFMLNHSIDFILKNDDMFQFHDFHCSQMLSSLRLRTSFISCNQKHWSIHDWSSCKHCCHQQIMSRTINEWDMSYKLKLRRTKLAFWVIWRRRTLWLECLWRRTCWTFEDLSICISKLDSNVSELFFWRLYSIDTRNSLNYSWFSVCDMPNSSNINSSLSRNDFWR